MYASLDFRQTILRPAPAGVITIVNRGLTPHFWPPMILLNKYARWYAWIVLRARKRGEVTDYTELHHIVPRSLGGTNARYNLVRLTAREHYLVHYLLTRMYSEDFEKTKMWNAFYCMHRHSTSNRYYRSRTYEISKRKMAESKRILMRTNNPFAGKTHTEETRQKMREKRVGRVCRRDYTVYTFSHPEHGLVESTQMDFYNNYNLCRKKVNSVVKGKVRSVRGWILKTVDK